MLAEFDFMKLYNTARDRGHSNYVIANALGITESGLGKKRRGERPQTVTADQAASLCELIGSPMDSFKRRTNNGI